MLTNLVMAKDRLEVLGILLCFAAVCSSRDRLSVLLLGILLCFAAMCSSRDRLGVLGILLCFAAVHSSKDRLSVLLSIGNSLLFCCCVQF